MGVLIIPSIDLEGGKAVKRVKGERGKYVFVGDPVELAKRFSKAPLVHIVDLDGAETGAPANLNVVSLISQIVEGSCEIGGGLRSRDSVKKALSVCDYAVVSTLPFTDRRLFSELAEEFAGRLVVSVDVLNGFVMGDGWRRPLVELKRAVEELSSYDLAAMIYTAIEVEGTGLGPLTASAELLKSVAKRVYYAGGISNCGHLEAVKRAGFDGAIIGYALHRGALDCLGDLSVSDSYYF